jgi:hypothetical protein
MLIKCAALLVAEQLNHHTPNCSQHNTARQQEGSTCVAPSTAAARALQVHHTQQSPTAQQSAAEAPAAGCQSCGAISDYATGTTYIEAATANIAV